MALFGFVNKTLAEQKAGSESKSPTARMLRKSGVAGQQAVDFETVLTASWEGTIRFLKQANIELGPREQGILRDILRASIDPQKAATDEERKRKQKDLDDLKAALRAELSGLAPQASTPVAIDATAIAAAVAAAMGPMMGQMVQVLRQSTPAQSPAAATSGQPVAPLPMPAVPATPPALADEVITFDGNV